ncbi:MAG: hypothetical protein M3014_01680, partial [Chloroflexota bacterium]|nr:hypothetical protein [Chloroflexota bacterium]
LFYSTGATYHAVHLAEFEGFLDLVQKQVAEETFTRAWEEGKAMTWEQVISYTRRMFPLTP